MAFDTTKWFKKQYLMEAGLLQDNKVEEAKDTFYPDSPEALSAATAKAREILDKHKASIKAIADKYEGQSGKGRQMQDELNALIDADSFSRGAGNVEEVLRKICEKVHAYGDIPITPRVR